MKKNQTSMLDQMFENRNKEYGAYELRVNYNRRLIKSNCIALLISSLLFLVPFVLTKIFRHQHAVKALTTEMTVDLSKTFNMEKPAVIAKLSPPHAIKAISKFDFHVVKNEEVKPNPDEKKVEEELKNRNSNATGVISDSSSASSDAESVLADAVSDEPMNVGVVDVPPSFPGGEKELYKYLTRYIHYPVVARENQVEGTVYASFVIGVDGKINKINIIRDPGAGMGEEVIRIITKMPDWSPGKYKGNAVKTIYCVPVRFSLSGSNI